MTEHNDRETRSYEEERQKPVDADARERMGDDPLAPSSAGVVGVPRDEEKSSAERDRAETERAAARPDDAVRGEVF